MNFTEVIEMITEKDTKILSHLRRDGRKKITEISKEIGIPATTIYDRLRALQKRYVRKHSVLLDFKKIGYPLVSYVTIEVNKDKKNQLYEHLMKNANVNSLYKINYGSKLLLETVFQSISQFESFIDALEKFNITGIQINHVSEELKKESFLTEAHHFSI